VSSHDEMLFNNIKRGELCGVSKLPSFKVDRKDVSDRILNHLLESSPSKVILCHRMAGIRKTFLATLVSYNNLI